MNNSTKVHHFSRVTRIWDELFIDQESKTHMHVVPRGAKSNPSPRTPRWRQNSVAFVGCGYALVTAAASAYYVHLFDATSANDLWWAGYISNGAQALVVDIFNKRLTGRSAGPADVMSPSATIDKMYSDAASTTEIYPSYPRRLVLLELISVEYAVTNLRALEASRFGYLLTQYCWVDLAKAFEVAHTTSRQERCASRYHANGAVYFETVLRNQVWDDFMQNYGGDSGFFTVAIQSWLEQVSAGQKWLATTSVARGTTSAVQEAAYWRSMNISYFQLQWHNQWQTGMDETMEIENALGLRSTITLKRLAYATTTWTSTVMYWTVFYDFYLLSQNNRSFIRSASNSFTQPPVVDFRSVMNFGGDIATIENQIDLFQTTMGQLGSVDTFYVATPPFLLALYDAFHAHLDDAQGSSRLTTFDSIPTKAFQPTPPSWSNSNLVFYGGNPMCFYRSGLPYVQDTFGFSDPCVNQPPLLVTSNKYSGLFAAMALGNQFQPRATCALQSTLLDCESYVGKLVEIASKITPITPLVSAAADAMSTLNVGIMQYAGTSNGSNWTLLEQSLLQGDPAWVFYGWVFLYDWLQGKREVVSFEGDLMTLALISAADTPQHLPSNTGSVSSATRLIFYLVVYTTLILGVLAISCIAGACLLRMEVQGTNLFWFNRIVSSIWIGRPLVFIRGVTAILVLSTTQLAMAGGSSLGSTRFVFAPRPWYATMVAAGETTWVLYATQDVLTVFTQRYTARYVPWSSALAWLALVVLETQWPVMPSGAFNQVCSAKNMDKTVACTGSLLQIGSFARVCVVLTILAVSTIMAMAIMIFDQRIRKPRVDSNLPPRHMLGIADYLLAYPIASSMENDHCWSLDKVSCLMAGLVPVRWNDMQYTFDIKLWVINRDKQLTRGSTMSFAFHSNKPGSCTPLSPSPFDNMAPKFKIPQRIQQLAIVLGMVYVVGSIIGCVSYLQVSRIGLSNDMFWATFNMTGAHTFLGSWLNTQLILGRNESNVALNAADINQDGPFDKPTGIVVAASNFGGLMQYAEMNTIKTTIQSLRFSDACSMPWIFTQYCFVDFNQTWEMANSAARQARCQNMTTNGAVFFESILRNIRFDEFYTCWGQAFEVSVANELRQTSLGQFWLLAMSATVKMPVVDEIMLWKSHKIVNFVTQWQNFKHIGLINTYSVHNVFGVSYAFTLQHQEAAFRLSEQSTFKMYWGLASDFVAVTQNSSTIRGLSLVRSSPQFAFANTTMEAILVQNGTLVAPLVASFAIFSNIVGPFGSVDLRFVPCPAIVVETVRRVKTAVRIVMSQNGTSAAAYSQIQDPWINTWPIPKVWIDTPFVSLGGDPTCPQLSFRSGFPITGGLQSLLSSNVQCSSAPSYGLSAASRETVLESIVLGNLWSISADNVTQICTQDIGFESVCYQFLTQSVAFVNTFMGVILPDLVPLVTASNDAIHSLNIELIQYGQLDSTSPVLLYRLGILEQAEFTCFAWNMIGDWVTGSREVVSFEGDNGTLTVLTDQLSPYQGQVNVAEQPTALAFYLRNTVYYITGALIGLASIMLLYIIFSRGLVEVMNLLELQRVGALVWIGRPLLVVRSLTAVALLSTSTLQLVFNGSISYFDVVQDPWYKTLLAANEITWMVAIVNDIAMAVTRDYTTYYATPNSILVWLVVMTWSFASPIRHSMSINKQCQLAQVDFQVVCESASITIGYLPRLIAIVGIVFGCNTLCYVTTRLLMKHPTPTRVDSIFVYAGARYLLMSSQWIHNDVYYMDRMSAVLNGTLTLRHGNTMFGLDIKLWRIFQVEIPQELGIPLNNTELAVAATYALPITLLPR
ncbi:Aste57867_20671 [Aphanomyces stellatus]|uniref:Aste57867_20671 protein n=1 Tax=Aphanomyces stellatus TaxID=120398 RepID=A0A485LGY9_9STRA|nr:hypothetical protein As57867_020603 [Aphanomyces stellatus]VFT97351.1 Aste57867_20671 [Aphanomyces stellatus]